MYISLQTDDFRFERPPRRRTSIDRLEFFLQRIVGLQRSTLESKQGCLHDARAFGNLPEGQVLSLGLVGLTAMHPGVFF